MDDKALIDESLPPHRIWYYRKVTTLPCGRRKEIKKSLYARDKLGAHHHPLTGLLAKHGGLDPSAIAYHQRGGGQQQGAP
ncbi:MAG: hypothetical protein ACRC9M_02035, partial [Aeromonas sp.]